MKKKDSLEQFLEAQKRELDKLSRAVERASEQERKRVRDFLEKQAQETREQVERLKGLGDGQDS
jgi:hypothetical protein